MSGMILALAKKQLVEDVEKTAKENRLAIRDCWEMILENPKTPIWMGLVAQEEIERDRQNVIGFLDAIEKAGFEQSELLEE